MERNYLKAEHADGDESFIYGLGPSGTNAFQAHVQSSGVDSVTPDKKNAIGRIFASAFNAATACEDMGYDGEACVKALPELVDVLTMVEECLDGGYSLDERDRKAIRQTLAKCRC